MDIRKYISENKLIFDGAMGTYFAEKYRNYGETCELACIEHPEYVREIHLEYLKSGCNALKTNTFSANPLNSLFAGDRFADIIRAACTAAQTAIDMYESGAAGQVVSAAPQDAGSAENMATGSLSTADLQADLSGLPHWIFADIGPVNHSDTAEILESFRQVCDVFDACGIRNFLFETLSNDFTMKEIAAYIKAKNPDAFIIASFAVQPDGYTREGMYIADIVERLRGDKNIDVLGLNCVSGAFHMKELLKKINTEGLVFSVMPNAGYPRVVANRTFYDSNPVYFAEQIREMADAGVSVLGGCCGTKPVYIKNVVNTLYETVAVGEVKSVDMVRREKYRVSSVSGISGISGVSGNSGVSSDADGNLESLDAGNRFWNKLSNGKKVIAVELDPPRQADATKFMSGAWMLKAAGVDAITIADCATARASMDSSIMACKIRRELDVDTIPHMTCRDRNLNATKALLLGLSMEGVNNVLAVTGDPIPSAERDEVKSVYQFNSRMLAGYISSLNENEFQRPFRIYGALNVNARKFENQLRFAHEKVGNGVSCFLTQPVLTDAALENLKRAHDELVSSYENVKILGGIIPVVSSRNARFMNSEISGITVDDRITELYEGKSRDECTKLAIDISTEIAGKIADYCDGYYLMTPFSRTDIISEIVKNIRGL